MIVSVCLDSALVFGVGNSFLFRFSSSFVFDSKLKRPKKSLSAYNGGTHECII